MSNSNNFFWGTLLILMMVQFQLNGQNRCISSPEPATTVQPDGKLLHVIGIGTRSFARTQTEDHYTLLRDKTGAYEYAMQDKNGNLVSSGYLAHDLKDRSIDETNFLKTIAQGLTYSSAQIISIQNKFKKKVPASIGAGAKSFPSSGTRKVLLLLIQYPDLTQTHAVSDFNNLMNQTGYTGAGSGTGSFRDYFLETSFGQLTLNTDVFGWYTASNSFTYYADSSSNPDAQRELVAEAVDAAEAAGVDFSQYDNDGDGNVDGIIVVHAGPGAEIGNQTQYIWSHRSSLWGATSRTYDGVNINDYMINPERREPNMVKIGVFCHEFGHGLGLPDLYDTDDTLSGTSEGIGEWGIMGSCGYLNDENTPCHFCAWSKEKLGWQVPTVISAANTYYLNPAATNNFSYKILSPTLSEYFLIENRQKKGFDAYLNGEGLAIWHIDTDKTNLYPGSNSVNADETNKGVDLEEADGLGHLDAETNRGDAGDLYPGSSSATVFGDATSPDSKTYAGLSSGIEITAIIETDTILQFNLGCVPPPAPPSITGITSAFENSVNNAYSVTPIGGVTTYTWLVPSGATVTGQGNNSVTIDFATTQGNVCVYTTNACGISLDTTCLGVTLNALPPFTCNMTISNFPYSQDFESFSTCSGASGSTCVLPVASGWFNDTLDNIDWTVFEGATGSLNTGPTMDFNPGTATGNYLYTEASTNGVGFPNMEAIVTTPCFDLADLTNTTLSFAYHLYGLEMGTMYVEVDSGSGWVNVATYTGDLGDTWNQANIDLSAYDGVMIKIRIRGITGTDYTSDMAIDDFSITGNTTCLTTISSFPYSENFESFPTCSDVAGAACALPALSGWINAAGDDIDWTVDEGGTISGSTGPAQDYDPGTVTGNYLYLESSSPSYPSKKAQLISPCFDLTSATAPNLSFAYHMYGVDMGSLAVKADTGTGWITLATYSGDQGNVWKIGVISLSAFKGTTVRLMFEGITGAGFTSDLAIDAINITTTAGPAPIADFSGTPTALTAGQTVSFTDLSTNAPTNWNWTFEGGTPSVSNVQNPVITYNTSGVYYVTLVVTNINGQDSITKTNYITVSGYCSSGATSNIDTDIDSVNFVQINRSSVGVCSAYTDYLTDTAQVNRGMTYPLTVRTADCDGATVYYRGTEVYIDWNGDGDFVDAGEFNILSLPNGPDTTITVNVTVPVGATLGTTRMRIVATEGGVTGSCGLYTYGETEDYSIKILPAVPVADFSGTPLVINTGGTVNFTDLTTNAPTNWQWSFAGGSPATSILQNPAISYSVPGVYAVQLIASNSGGSDTILKAGYVTVLDTSLSYCIPNPTNGTADGDFILSFSLGTISNLNNSIQGDTNYVDYTSMSTDMTKGVPDTITIVTGDYINDNFAVWVDYNQDGDFDDAGEKIGEVASTVANETIQIPIVVPGTALNGPTTIRIRSVWNNAPLNPCTDYAYGETEDYTINILPSSAPLPIADFVGVPTTLITGNSVNFTDLSSNTPTNWIWSFSGGTPSTSLVQNPVITYNTPGVYAVTLIAINAGGGDTLTKTSYITVNGYCVSSAISNIDTEIDSVDFAGINRVSSSNCAVYTSYLTDTANVMLGSTYPLTVRTGDCNGAPVFDRAVEVYVDWNQDSDFDDPGESGILSEPNGPMTTTNANITIPLSATLGATRMRIVCTEGGVAGACGTYSYGETEDYTINISSACTPPVFGVSYVNPVTCGGKEGILFITGLNASDSYTVRYDSAGITQAAQTYTSTPGGQISLLNKSADTYTNISVALNSCFVYGISASTITMSDPTPPSFAVGTSNPTTCGGNDGKLRLTGLAVATTYAITYQQGASTVGPVNYMADGSGVINITGLVAATYTNISVALNSCPAVDSGSYVLSDPSAPTFGVSASNPTTCSGSEGFLQLTGLNASTVYVVNYDKNGIPAGPINVTTNAFGVGLVSGLSAGTYTSVSVALNNCPSTDSSTFILTDPAGPTFSVLSFGTSTCSGSDGSLQITGLSISTAYSVSYEKGAVPSGPLNLTSNGAGTIILSGLSQGTFNNISVGINNCFTVDNTGYSVSDPAPPTFGVGTSNPSSCGGTNGNLRLTGLLASTVYSVAYDKGGTNVGPANFTSDAGGVITITGLNSDNYSNLSVTINNCSATDATTYSLVDPAPSSFAVGTADPTTCGGSDGVLRITGLTSSTSYQVSYFNGISTIGPSAIVSDGSGEIAIGALVQGVYSMISVTGNNCTTTDSASYSLSDPTGPAFAVTAYNTSVCGGSDGRLEVSGLNSSTSYTLSYDSGITTAGPLVLVSDGTGMIAVNGLGSGNYSNVTLTLGGCTTTDSAVYSISDPSGPSFTMSSSNPTSCGGTDGSITLSGLNASQGYIITYKKDGVGIGPFNMSSDGSGILIISGLMVGSYSDVEVATILGCASLNGSVVALSGPSSPTFTVSGFNPGSCGATDGYLSLQGLNLSTSYSVSYNSSGVLVGPTTFISDATGEITISALSSGGYSDLTVSLNSCSTTDSGVYNLNDPGAPLFSISSVNPTTCGGTDGSIKLLGLNGSTTYSVNYSKGGSSVGASNFTSDAGGNIILSGLSQGVFSAISVDLAGCTSVAGVVVELTDPVVAQPTISVVGDSSICPGENTILAIIQPGTYQWYHNGAIITGATAISYTAGMAGSYTVEINRPDNCIVVSNPVQVIVHSVSPGTISGLQPGYCDNQAPDTLTGSPVGGTFAGTGMVSGNVFDPASATVGVNVIMYNVLDTNGCMSGDTLTTLVEQAIAPTLTISSVVNNLTVNFTGSSSTGGTVGWNWSFGDGNSSNLQNPTYSYSSDGSYYVCVSATNSCNATGTTCDSVAVMSTGLDDLKLSALELYPNPTTGLIYVEGVLDVSDRYSMVIFNSVGQQMFVTSSIANGSLIKEQLDLSKYSDGIYTIKITVNESVTYRKIMVSK